MAIRKIQIINPHRARKPKRNSRGRSKRNPGALYLMTNSHKPSRRRRGSRRRSASAHHGTRHNPHTQHSGRRRSRRHIMVARRHRRNPAATASAGFNLTSPTFWLEAGGGALIGAFGPTNLSQMVLGTKNTGAMGYISDAVGTIVLALGAKMLLKKNALAGGIVAGGIAALGLRWYQENSSSHPVAQAIAQGAVDGNANAAPGLGLYAPMDFAYPQTWQWQNGGLTSAPRVSAPALPPAQAVAAVPAQGTQAELSRYSRY